MGHRSEHYRPKFRDDDDNIDNDYVLLCCRLLDNNVIVLTAVRAASAFLKTRVLRIRIVTAGRRDL